MIREKLHLIGDEQVRQTINMTEAIHAMDEAFAEISSGNVEVPVRTVLENAEKNGMMLSMPAYSKSKNLFSIKIVSLFQENSSHSLPSIQGKVLILDGNTGIALALIDAGYLTALRTGAASGLATKLLSREDASVLAIVAQVLKQSRR